MRIVTTKNCVGVHIKGIITKLIAYGDIQCTDSRDPTLSNNHAKVITNKTETRNINSHNFNFTIDYFFLY